MTAALLEKEIKYRKDLINTIRERDFKKTRILIKGQTLNFFIDDQTPLMHACSYAPRIALEMLQHGVDVNQVNSQGKTAVFFASANGYYEVVKALHEKQGFKVLTDNSSTNLLHYAVNSNSKQTTKLLIDLGLDVNPRDCEGKTPLHYAAWHGYTEISEILISKGALVNLLDDKRNSPILYATDLNTIKLLLDYNAKILTNGKKTLIHTLIEKNHFEEVKYLHERLGNEKVESILGPNSCTPMLYSVFNDNYEMTKYFIDKGYNVDIPNQMGLTPLMRAVEKKNFPMVKMLVEHGANVYAKNKSGETVFLLACKHGDLNMIKYLYQFDPCTNQQDSNGYTSLTWAILYKYDNVCDFLIENGAEPTIQNKYKKDAIQLALESNNKYFEKFKV